MCRTACASLLVLLSLPLQAQHLSTHPTVTAVAGIRLFAANLENSREFYGKTLGLRECSSKAALCFQVSAVQKIELESLGQDNRPDRLVFVAFETRDVATLLEHMITKGVQSTDEITRVGGTKVLDAYDPDGHVVEFVEHLSPMATRIGSPVQVSSSIIHVGFVVQNRTAMDHFYKDILGFHVYWHGGRKDDETSWVDMQVPDGTDWLEYMLNVPPDADHKRLGVMNHIALGVPDIKAAREQLIKNGWDLKEEPKIGRDGKWQLNLYDPDGTRVELMEFTPSQQPCCAPYTGPHPKP